VNGKICAAIKDGLLNFTREDPGTAKLTQGIGLILISGRHNQHQFHVWSFWKLPQQCSHMIGLPESEWTFAGCDAQCIHGHEINVRL
jgi:hypothetical protein